MPLLNREPELPIKKRDLKSIAQRNKEIDFNSYNRQLSIIMIILLILLNVPLYLPFEGFIFILSFAISWGGGFTGLIAYYMWNKQKILEEIQGTIGIRYIVRDRNGNWYTFKMVKCRVREITIPKEISESSKDLVFYEVKNDKDKVIIGLPKIHEPFRSTLERAYINMYEITIPIVSLLGSLIGETILDDERIPVISVIANQSIIDAIENDKLHNITIGVKINKIVDIATADESRRVYGYELDKIEDEYRDFVKISEKVQIRSDAKASAMFNRLVATFTDLIGGGKYDTKELVFVLIGSIIAGIFIGWLLWG